MYCKIQFQFPDISIYLPLEISTYLKGFLFPSTLAVQFNTWAVLGPLTCHLATLNTRDNLRLSGFWVQPPLLCKSFSLTLDSTPVIFPTAHYSYYNRENNIFCFYFSICHCSDHFWKIQWLLLPTLPPWMNSAIFLVLYWKTWNVTPILDTEHLHCKWWPKPESKAPLSSLANQLNSSTPGLIRLGGPKVTGCGCY